MNLTLESAFYLIGITFMIIMLVVLIALVITSYILYQRLQRTKTLATRAIQTGITGQILRFIPTKGAFSLLALVPLVFPFWKRLKRNFN
jgi:hypothetical protein